MILLKDIIMVRVFYCWGGGTLGEIEASTGLKEQEAIDFLEKKMILNSPMTRLYSLFTVLQTAISALQSVLQEDFKASEIQVGVVRRDNPAFQFLALGLDCHH
nr:proteasome subunit alpha type-6 [Tanacetum cinerariifolium]